MIKADRLIEFSCPGLGVGLRRWEDKEERQKQDQPDERNRSHRLRIPENSGEFLAEAVAIRILHFDVEGVAEVLHRLLDQEAFIEHLMCSTPAEHIIYQLDRSSVVRCLLNVEIK